ncbi:hypothetical protein FLK61_35060 [Paenalkalicoccus suaedae]|uniref:MarR family transcriptional regulator n=1 Tax=Paenalkalicoccus suaedae TaxID=2592382 RepID=A0A859FFF8_9BACI|nr:hypothetical protein [Paenalkalicoccus suaedae]QKS71889.1 hypothetical protein FLK61_35060 [Paenalkalicoccus suaedae]
MTDAERKLMRIITNMYQQKDRKATFRFLEIYTGKNRNELVNVLRSLEEKGKIEVDYAGKVAMLIEEYGHEKRARWERESSERNKGTKG